MDTISDNPAPSVTGRMTSVDLFRGMTMFFLVGEGAGFYGHFESMEGNGIGQFIGMLFTHHDWHGLHFWDLITAVFHVYCRRCYPICRREQNKKRRFR